MAVRRWRKFSRIWKRPRCKNCKWWNRGGLTFESGLWAGAQTCNNPDFGAGSEHPANVNFYGPPTTKPDFGCIQFEHM